MQAFLVQHNDGREWMIVANSPFDAIIKIAQVNHDDGKNYTTHHMRTDRAYEVALGRLFLSHVSARQA